MKRLGPAFQSLTEAAKRCCGPTPIRANDFAQEVATTREPDQLDASQHEMATSETHPTTHMQMKSLIWIRTYQLADSLARYLIRLAKKKVAVSARNCEKPWSEEARMKTFLDWTATFSMTLPGHWMVLYCLKLQ